MASTETEISAAYFAGCSNLMVRSELKLRHDRAAAKTDEGSRGRHGQGTLRRARRRFVALRLSVDR
jgi:hypothetical protein